MITIDVESPVPLEDQLRKALRSAIARREVAPGDLLPSARQLGSDLGIHWNTVARTYRRLRDEGLLVVRRGRGVYVKEISRRAAQKLPRTRERVVTNSINEAIIEARLAGLSLEGFRAIVLGEVEKWEDQINGQSS